MTECIIKHTFRDAVLSIIWFREKRFRPFFKFALMIFQTISFLILFLLAFIKTFIILLFFLFLTLCQHIISTGCCVERNCSVIVIGGQFFAGYLGPTHCNVMKKGYFLKCFHNYVVVSMSF